MRSFGTLILLGRLPTMYAAIGWRVSDNLDAASDQVGHRDRHIRVMVERRNEGRPGSARKTAIRLSRRDWRRLMRAAAFAAVRSAAAAAASVPFQLAIWWLIHH
jgi:hypothetical protein